MLNLARQFVARMETGFATVEEERPTNPTQIKRDRIRRAFDSLLDGEVLLLNITLISGRKRDTIFINEPIIAIKEGHDVMVSLADFVSTANFAIRVDAEAGQAKGWFIRENQLFELDIPQQQARIGDQIYPITPADARIQDGDLLVKGQVLAKWFNFTMTVNPGRQEALIDSEQKWPAEEKIERYKRSQAKSGRIPPPSLPRLDDPLKQASVPNVDLFTRDQFLKPGSGDRGLQKKTNFTIQTAGDIAGHTAESYWVGDDQEHLTSGRLTMSKTSENQDLLGPLKARSYSFMDVPTTPIPYAGSSPFETGFRFSNRDPYTTYDTSTTVSGDGVPGWDVELFRDDSYVSSAVTGDDGRYVFDDVILFSGANNFKIIQYGPQGEIKEEVRTISVRPKTFNNDNGAYDISLSAQNMQLYTKEKSDDPDRYQPHLSATYEYQVDENLALRSGARFRQEAGKDRVYLHGGAVETFGHTVLNQDVVANNEGAWTGAFTGRQNIGKHRLYGTAQYSSEDFNPDADSNEPAKFKLDANAKGPLPDMLGERNSYNLAARYEDRADGTGVRSGSAGYTTRIGKVGLNNRVIDRVITHSDGSTFESVDNSFAIRGNMLGVNWNGTADYNIYPNSMMEEYNLSLKKRINPKLNTEFEITYLPPQDFMLYQLSANWQADYARISPALTYNSDNDLALLLRTSIGATYNPYNQDVALHGTDVSDKGGVAARVFLDTDGDNVYTEKDQLIEGAVVRALHARRQDDTDENGEAFIYDLPTNKITDLVVLEGSMFEPSWIPATPGVSLRPRPGHISRVEFPIVNSGEVDGTIYGQTASGKARSLGSVNLRLVNKEGRIVQKTVTANDGFYLFTKIPPGRYLIIPDPEDLKSFHVSSIVPRPIEFGYDGGVIYSNNIVFPAGPEFGFDVVSAEALEASYPGVALPAAGRVVLNLGTFNAPITMAVTWYRLKLRYNSILADLRPLFDDKNMSADAANGLYTLRLALPDLDINDAFQRCRALAARDIFCTVEHIPGSGLSSAQADLPPKG